MKHKKGTSANILMIGIFSLLAVGSWVIFDVSRALTKTTVPVILQKQIEPLPVDISAATIGKLRSRRQFDPLELNTVNSIRLKAPVASESAPLIEIIPVEPLPASNAASLEASSSGEGNF